MLSLSTTSATARTLRERIPPDSPTSNPPTLVFVSGTQWPVRRHEPRPRDHRPDGGLPMMRVIAIGRARDGPEADLFARYNARIRPTVTVTEIPDGRGAQAEIKRREGEALMTTLPAQAFAVALDLGGDMLDSAAFATRLEYWLTLSRPVCFLIGGAEGLDQPVIARANFILSLGRMTWPHLLVRAMLAEQIYRARSIVTGHPYHRSGRPG